MSRFGRDTESIETKILKFSNNNNMTPINKSNYDFENLSRLILTEKSREAIFRETRERGTALIRAKKIRDGFESKSLSKRWNKCGITGPQSRMFDDINHFLIDRFLSAINALHQDKFMINYNIYCDIEREVILDENTVGIKVDVDWIKRDIDIKMSSGVPSNITLKPEITQMLRNGALNRSEFVKIANLEYDSIKQMEQDKHHKLLNVIKSALGGQNLLTRLVKGILLMLDLKEVGYVKRRVNVKSIQFSVDGLLKTVDNRNSAFVYCSVPTSSKHVAFLNCMAGEYPSKDIPSSNSHVRIPADGTVYIVSDMSIADEITATMTAEEGWSSMLTYCRYMGVVDQLEKAMLIAMSLAQNRYLSTAYLPAVVSNADLVRPLMSNPHDSTGPRPMMNLEAGIVAGRAHQMSVFAVLKDMIVSARSSVLSKNWTSTTLSVIKSKQNTLTRIGATNSSLQLLARIPELNWWHGIDKKDLKRLNDVSIFEALWLNNTCTDGLFAGIFKSLVDGSKNGLSLHPTGEKSAYRVLVDEMYKAGVAEDQVTLKMGRYTTDAPSMEPLCEDDGFEDFEESFEIDMDEDDDEDSDDEEDIPKQRYIYEEQMSDSESEDDDDYEVNDDDVQMFSSNDVDEPSMIVEELVKQVIPQTNVELTITRSSPVPPSTPKSVDRRKELVGKTPPLGVGIKFRTPTEIADRMKAIRETTSKVEIIDDKPQIVKKVSRELWEIEIATALKNKEYQFLIDMLRGRYEKLKPLERLETFIKNIKIVDLQDDTKFMKLIICRRNDESAYVRKILFDVRITLCKLINNCVRGNVPRHVRETNMQLTLDLLEEKMLTEIEKMYLLREKYEGTISKEQLPHMKQIALSPTFKQCCAQLNIDNDKEYMRLANIISESKANSISTATQGWLRLKYIEKNANVRLDDMWLANTLISSATRELDVKTTYHELGAKSSSMAARGCKYEHRVKMRIIELSIKRGKWITDPFKYRLNRAVKFFEIPKQDFEKYKELNAVRFNHIKRLIVKEGRANDDEIDTYESISNEEFQKHFGPKKDNGIVAVLRYYETR